MSNFKNPFFHFLQTLRWKISGFFPGTRQYWEERYKTGGTSGKGSYGKFAAYKAEVINQIIETNDITTVIEYGCGDGHQLSLLRVKEYLGFDISETAVTLCREKFKGDSAKQFKLTSQYQGETADLTLSIEVIFHLFEYELFEQYMNLLFASSRQYVLIFSSNSNQSSIFEGIHVKHRKFTDWVEKNQPAWQLVKVIPNPFHHATQIRQSFSDFYFYAKKQ